MIREAAEEDWPRVYPIFAAIVTEGRTFAYPENLSCEEARGVWMEKPPGRTVIADDGARVLGSAKMVPTGPGVVHTSPPPASWSTPAVTGAVSDERSVSMS